MLAKLESEPYDMKTRKLMKTPLSGIGDRCECCGVKWEIEHGFDVCPLWELELEFLSVEWFEVHVAEGEFFVEN